MTGCIKGKFPHKRSNIFCPTVSDLGLEILGRKSVHPTCIKIKKKKIYIYI